MAAIAVTISSNNVGMVTSSYTLQDHDLSRILDTLKIEYGMNSPVDLDKENDDIPDDAVTYTIQQLIDRLAYYFLAGLSEKVRNIEYKIEVEKIKEGFNPIAFNKAS